MQARPPDISHNGGVKEAHMPNTAPDAASLTNQLMDEFAQHLDHSLIIAMTLDRDIVSSYNEIRNDLLTLAESATFEAATGFDPSGLGHLTETENAQVEDEGATSYDGNPQSRSTDLRSSFSESSDLESPLATFADQAELSNADKVKNLQEIFNFAEHTIAFILGGCNGDFERAFEELQTRQYLEENGELPRGVEGFAEPCNGKKRRSERRQRSSAQPKQGRAPLELQYSLTALKLDDDDLEASRASGQRSKQASKPLQLPLASSISQTTSKRQTVPVGATYLAAGSSTTKTTNSSWQEVKSKAVKKSEKSEPLFARPPEVGNHNLRAAASMARRGASDPLYRQGVAVYTTRAREDFQVARAQSSIDAERFVDATSTPTQIDLHGVSVVDGVKIAKARVRAWWEALGEDRAKKAQLHGYTVVTGLGRHSVNGVSRLRQAVAAALKNDGWRVTTLTGEFYITGRA